MNNWFGRKLGHKPGLELDRYVQCAYNLFHAPSLQLKTGVVHEIWLAAILI